jgi:hypothetical protein
MIQKHATPPRFGTMPLDDADDLFDLHPHTCADCGESFATSSRTATRCASCASLRSGQVGPATVQCPACGKEHQIPVLSPTKLCGPCRLDPVMTLAACRARLDAAQAESDAAWERQIADLAHADEKDRARYDAAVELRTTGALNGKTYPPALRSAAWHNALAAADGLSPLLAGYDRWQAAVVALEAAQTALAAVEEAIG